MEKIQSLHNPNLPILGIPLYAMTLKCISFTQTCSKSTVIEAAWVEVMHMFFSNYLGMQEEFSQNVLSN